MIVISKNLMEVINIQVKVINFCNIAKDKMMQYTGFGIHKDDLVFEIDGYPIKKFGSQGQQKSFLIALKLAQFDFIKVQSGETPLLLLDDVFDKLDEHRGTDFRATFPEMAYLLDDPTTDAE